MTSVLETFLQYRAKFNSEAETLGKAPTLSSLRKLEKKETRAQRSRVVLADRVAAGWKALEGNPCSREPGGVS